LYLTSGHPGEFMGVLLGIGSFLEHFIYNKISNRLKLTGDFITSHYDEMSLYLTSGHPGEF
jgi:hypothetical protein